MKTELRGLFDIHCHILPEVDDGASDLEEAVGMLEKEQMEGVYTIIATPHYRKNMFDTEVKELKEKYQQLKLWAEEKGIHLYLGCEYFAEREMVKMLNEGERLTMAGSSYVLVEFSNEAEKEDIYKLLDLLQYKKYLPIVAHVERCQNMNLGFVEELVDSGIYIQMNASSIMGKHGFHMKRYANKLFKKRLVHFVASDAHGVVHRAPNLQECVQRIEKKYGKGYAEEIFIKNPEKIILNEVI